MIRSQFRRKWIGILKIHRKNFSDQPKDIDPSFAKNLIAEEKFEVSQNLGSYKEMNVLLLQLPLTNCNFLQQLPPEPDNCCMSGCANCVWIQYAQDLTTLYKDSGETAKKIIMKKIKDPTMQVFLKMELSEGKK